MYINEVERLDGFGQEIFPVKVTHCTLCYISLLRKTQEFGKPALTAVGQGDLAFLLPHGSIQQA
jgi:hypothetical protein